MGHPRIFINVDKPEIVPCGYCGLPFVGFPSSTGFCAGVGIGIGVLIYDIGACSS